MKTSLLSQNRFLSLMLLLTLFFLAPKLNAQIDLELNMTGTPLEPGAFRNYTFSLTLSNTGTSTATDVEVDIPLPAGFIYQGGNEYVASQGTYDIFSERVWIVGSLNAGATATFELNLYSLQSVNLYLYAEVSNASQNDIDSTPDNGGCTSPDPSSCITLEDDEALFIISNSGTCSISSNVLTTTCFDSNNTPDPLDDTWSFTIQVEANNSLSNGWITNSQGYNGLTGNYGEAVTIGNFFINAGPLEFTLFDQQNTDCFTTFTVSPPQPCSSSSCSLTATTSPSICSDSGTPNDPSDDGFQFFLYVNPDNASSNEYQVTVSNNSGADVINVAYTDDLLISKFIADGPVTLSIQDRGNSNCTTSLILDPPAPCSGNPPNPGVDLELKISTTTPNPNNYTPVKFSFELTNTGTENATGIRVEIPDVPELAYVAHETTAGTFSSFLEFWEVGTVNAGSSVTLNLELFTLSEDPINVYAQVFAQNETDADSSPNNGTCTSTACTANEDDESLLVLNGGGTPPTNCSFNAVLADLVCDNNNSVDPSDDTYTISINPSGIDLGATFEITGGGLALGGIPYGQNYTSPALPISSGNFILTITDVSGNCSTEISIIPPPPCSVNNPPGVDLEMSLSASQNEVRQWENFSMTLTVNNTGSRAANNVVVSFPLPEGLVFNGGDPYTASQGVFGTFTEEWEVGNIPAGGSAMMQVNLFNLRNSPVTGYTQVLSLAETDVDSSPGNGVCCTAVEDDEAAITLAIGNTLNNKLSKGSKQVRTQIHNLYPNPVINELNLVVESAEERQAWIEIYNAQGQIQRRENSLLQEGINFLEIHLSDLPAGVYFVHLPGNSRPLGLTKFLIQQ